MLDLKKLIVCGKSSSASVPSFFILLVYIVVSVSAFTCILLLHGSQSSSYSYVSPVAKQELLHSFQDAWKLDDVAAVHYATTSYRILKEKLPIPEKVYIFIRYIHFIISFRFMQLYHVLECVLIH